MVGAAHSTPTIPGGTERTIVVVPGKEQTDIAMAVPVAGASAPDFYDLDVANIVLGQFGLMGRIGESVRQKQGLAYYAFCTINPRKTQSLWFVRAGVDPANVDRAIESVLAVVHDAEANGLTAEEIDGTRQLMTGRLALTMQTNAGLASLLQTIHEFDLGLDYVERYPSILANVSPESARAALIPGHRSRPVADRRCRSVHNLSAVRYVCNDLATLLSDSETPAQRAGPHPVRSGAGAAASGWVSGRRVHHVSRFK